MMKESTKKIIYPVISLFVICLVVSSLVVVTNSLTKDKIAQQQEKETAEIRSRVLPADSYEDVSDTAAKAVKDGKTAGYVFSESSKGYGGEIKVIIGISADGKISGVEVLSHSETAGIGAKCTEKEFLDKFTGKDKILSDGEIKRTGASITSKGLSDAVNKALKEFSSICGGEAE